MAENNIRIEEKTIEISTSGDGDIINITAQIEDSLRKTKLKDGIVTCFIVGSTAALTTIEYEPGLKQDLPRLMEKLVPKGSNYAHNATWGDGNGFSHLRASLIGPSLVVPFKSAKLALGTWQQVVFLEFDNTSRSRKIVLQFIGS